MNEFFNAAMSYLPAVLKHLGYDTMRSGQDKAVYNLFAQQDVICVLPTGQGKTSVYLIPTMCCQWRTLVFSPLIALMQDQVETLWRAGIKAGQLSSGQTAAENASTIAQWMAGQLQILLVAPERMDNQDFMLAITTTRPNLIVVDEAHTIAQWGDSFRPHYARLGDFIAKVKPDNILALTATCPEDVEVEIRRVLGLAKATKVVYYPKRRNLELSSGHFGSDVDVLNFVNGINGPCIVYCSTIKKTEEMLAALGHHVIGRGLIYNGSMTPDERSTNQSMFMHGDVRVMFATKAFGLGINKADIRAVCHRDIPGSIDDLAQEMGRAGRDGNQSWCRLFFEPKTYDTQHWFVQTAHPDQGKIEAVFRAIQRNLDADGICKVTIDNLAKQAGIQSAYADSAIGHMISSGVITRNFEVPKTAQVIIKRPHLDEECMALLKTIEKIGCKDKIGWIEYNTDTLQSQSDLKPKKITDTLKLLDKEGYIQYVAPFRGKPTKIIGDVRNVDFERIKRKFKDALAKLNRVIEYHETPDNKKHDYLLSYFGITAEQQVQ